MKQVWKWLVPNRNDGWWLIVGIFIFVEGTWFTIARNSDPVCELENLVLSLYAAIGAIAAGWGAAYSWGHVERRRTVILLAGLAVP